MQVKATKEVRRKSNVVVWRVQVKYDKKATVSSAWSADLAYYEDDVAYREMLDNTTHRRLLHECMQLIEQKLFLEMETQLNDCT